MTRILPRLGWLAGWTLGCLLAHAARAQVPDRITPAQLAEEAIVFTPPGFAKTGEPKWAGTTAGVSGMRTGHVEIFVLEDMADLIAFIASPHP